MARDESRERDTEFFAHSTINPDKSDWQPLAQHLRNVSRKAGESAVVFGAQGFAELPGLLHDIGKYTHDFQRRIASVNIDLPVRSRWPRPIPSAS